MPSSKIISIVLSVIIIVLVGYYVLGGLGGSVSSPTPTPSPGEPASTRHEAAVSNNVGVLTGKSKYHQGEPVDIIIKNESNESIYLPPYYPFSIEHKSRKGTWTDIGALGPPPPPDMPSINRYTKVDAHTSYSLSWDQNVLPANTSFGKPVDKGTYRVRLGYVPESVANRVGKTDWPESKDFVTILSGEFSIQ